MGQPHQPHAQGIGALVGIKHQHPLMGQRLQQPVKRRLGIVGLGQKVGKAHRAAMARDHVEHMQRLAHRAVRVTFGAHAASPSCVLTG